MSKKIAAFGGCLRGGSPTTATDLPHLWPGQRWLPDGSDAWAAGGHRAGREATHHGADHETSASDRFRRPFREIALIFGNPRVPWREGKRERERNGEINMIIIYNCYIYGLGSICQLPIHCRKREADLRSLSTTTRLGFGPQDWLGWWCWCFRG